MAISQPPRLGGIYYVNDDEITLPPNDDRQIHVERRPVVVLSGPATNNDLTWPFVLVAPLSSSTQLKTKFCVKIAAGEGNVSRKTWVRVSATQPLMKTILQDFSGDLPPVRLEEIQARLLEYMGMIDPSAQ